MQSTWTQGATQASGDAAYVCREHRKPVEVVKRIISGKAAEAAQPVVPLCNMVESVRGAQPVPKNAVDKQSTTKHGWPVLPKAVKAHATPYLLTGLKTLVARQIFLCPVERDSWSSRRVSVPEWSLCGKSPAGILFDLLQWRAGTQVPRRHTWTRHSAGHAIQDWVREVGHVDCSVLPQSFPHPRPGYWIVTQRGNAPLCPCRCLRPNPWQKHVVNNSGGTDQTRCAVEPWIDLQKCPCGVLNKKTSFFAMCSLHFLHCIVSSMIKSSVMSVFLCLPCNCVHLLEEVFLNSGAILLWAHLCLENAKWNENNSIDTEPFLTLILVGQSVTQCKDIWLDCWRLRCDPWWSFTQDRLIVSDDFCNTFCWNVSEVNNSITACSTEFETDLSCFDQVHACWETWGTSCGCQLFWLGIACISCEYAVEKWHGCLPSRLPLPLTIWPSDKIVSRYCCERTRTINDIHQSKRNFYHVLDLFRIPNRSRQMTLDGSNLDRCVVVMLVPTSFKTDSVRSHFPFLQPLLCGGVRIDVWTVPLDLLPHLPWTGAVNVVTTYWRILSLLPTSHSGSKYILYH